MAQRRARAERPKGVDDERSRVGVGCALEQREHPLRVLGQQHPIQELEPSEGLTPRAVEESDGRTRLVGLRGEP